ncbi:hypothetical protein AK88_01852 [Plasmodium fragile]|uniref:Schizont-infected cell agglutination extracellular alpha domain-containing protein n=1 Tax=Plasmodium fragile TaxID=5857 RepID=A0A0D9QNT9_PLAFR|nr:uncharacterized protein AK88_01852 [Plasmodium fragile]KJP88573.1 hypothetical protein AK88_01852 [Plasmodium fragile]
MELYGRSEEHLQIIQEISDTLRNGGTVWTQKYADGICEGQDYGKYIFGSGIMRQSIRNRLKELGKHWVRGGRSPDRTSGKCTWPHAVQMEEEQQNTESCKKRAKEGKQDEQEIMELMDVAKTQLTTYLKTVISARWKSHARCTMEERIRTRIQTGVRAVGVGVTGGQPPQKGSSNAAIGDCRTRSPRPGTGPGRTPRPRPRPKPPQEAPTLPKQPTQSVTTKITDQSGSNSDASKPAPAKPNKPATAAKPVAAKPVVTKPVITKTTSGSGMTTTSSGGGSGSSGSGGKARPAAGSTGGGQGKKAGAAKCQGETILEWRPSEKYVVLPYSDAQWTRVQDVLEQFIEYLKDHNDTFDALGANCNNIGWNDLTHTAYHKGQRVADMMRCRIMSGALFFANQDTSDEQTNRLRCEVAHVLGHLLKTRYCKDTAPWPRGIEYAWPTFRDMKSGESGKPGAVRGPVMDGRCTMCGYVGNRKNVEAVDLKIAYWLMQEGGILGEIQAMEKEWPCEQYWDKYTNNQAEEREPDINKILTEAGQNEKKRLDKEIVQTAEKVFEKAKEAVEREIEKLKAVAAGSVDHVCVCGGGDHGSGSATGMSVDECKMYRIYG